MDKFQGPGCKEEKEVAYTRGAGLGAAFSVVGAARVRVLAKRMAERVRCFMLKMDNDRPEGVCKFGLANLDL